MSDSAFDQLEFWCLILSSVIVPTTIYWALLRKRTVSRLTVLFLGTCLVALSGLDVYFLQILSHVARASTSVADNVMFASELTTALYLVPIMFGGIGVNMISHTLIHHIALAEQRRDDEQAALRQSRQHG